MRRNFWESDDEIGGVIHDEFGTASRKTSSALIHKIHVVGGLIALATVRAISHNVRSIVASSNRTRRQERTKHALHAREHARIHLKPPHQSSTVHIPRALCTRILLLRKMAWPYLFFASYEQLVGWILDKSAKPFEHLQVRTLHHHITCVQHEHDRFWIDRYSMSSHSSPPPAHIRPPVGVLQQMVRRCSLTHL